jgi:hypothetical protein
LLCARLFGDESVFAMPIRLEKLPDQPIIIVTPDGATRCEEVKECIRESLELLANGSDLATCWKYFIVDVRTINMDLSELMCVLDYEFRGLTGTLSDAHTFIAVVGTNLLVRAFQKIGYQRGLDAALLPICMRIEDAHAAVQAHIDAR